MLNIQNLSAWYNKDNLIIDCVDINLEPNKIIGLLGINGAGKTTLINCICGVHNTYETSQLTFDEKNITFNDDDFKLSRAVAFTEDNSFPFWNFQEYLSFILNSYNATLDQEYLESLIAGFNFEEYVNYPLSELSTGNKKKAHLIATFMTKSNLLLLDEPLDGLDFSSSEFLYKVINEYKSHGTILLSSHIAESFEKTCDKILLLNQGKIKSYDVDKGFDIREKLSEWQYE